MGRGKHAGNPRDFEIDSSDYTNNSYEEKISNNFGDNANMNNDYSDYYDEDEQEVDYKKVFIIVASVLAIVMVGFLLYKFVFTKSEEPEEPTTPVENVEEKMITTLDGYDVLGKVVIEKINIEQYILDSIEEKALEKGIGKIYGGSLNNYGNLCLIGHNYDNIFARLPELEVGDEITLVDDDLEETKYEINEIFSIEPDNLECMIQPEDKIELTLITCETGATTRLVIKAEEKAENTEDTENEAVTNEVTNSVQDSEENL